MSYDTIRIHIALPMLKAANKKQALELLTAAVAEQTGYPQRLLLESLMDNEKTASSGVGDGVAIPHLKLAAIPGRLLTLATLAEPVEFDAPDSKPVDLICLLLSPQTDGPLHLRGLARISRILKDEALCQKLRETDDPEVVRSLVVNPEGWLIAA